MLVSLDCIWFDNPVGFVPLFCAALLFSVADFPALEAFALEFAFRLSGIYYGVGGMVICCLIVVV